jgi:hypothetical protein
VVGKIIVATKCDADLGKRAVSYANASVCYNFMRVLNVIIECKIEAFYRRNIVTTKCDTDLGKSSD